MSKFNLGQLLSTPGAIASAEAAGDNLLRYIARHTNGDWGTVDADDQRANDRALVEASQLLSAYLLTDGTKIWVLTEGDRSATTVLLPDEY